MARIAFLVALAALLLFLGAGLEQPSAQAIGTISQVSIDMQDAGNGIPGSGDRNGDGTADSEGAEPSPSAEPRAPCADGNDDDGDTTPDDGCTGGPAAVGSPEYGLCGNALNDDNVDLNGNGIFEAGDVFDFTADDGCVTTLSTQETCIEIWDDGILNMDEDTVDRARIDITVGNQAGPGGGIPAGEFMTAFFYYLNWAPDLIDGLSGANAPNPFFLISSTGAQAPWANITNAPALASPLTHGVSDSGPPETGPGVLSRTTIEGNAAGLATLTLTGVDIRDTSNVSYPITTIADGTVAAVSKDGPDGGTTIGDSPGEEFQCPVPVDLSVDSALVSAPSAATVDTSFAVTADVSLSNGGPQDVHVDTSITLSLPADCTTPDTNPVPDADRLITIAGSPVAVPQQSWTVTCTSPSNHSFTATATARVDEEGFTGSDSLTSTADVTAVTATGDPSVSSVSVSGPPSALKDVPFNVTVDAALGNSGPDPSAADATVTLAYPPDCTTPSNPRTITSIPVPLGGGPLPQQTFSVTCSDRSNHQFDATVDIQPALHVLGDIAGNNSDQSDSPATVPVWAEADLAVSSVNVNAPASVAINAAFDVTADVTIVNNGPYGPVNGGIAYITLSLPVDCTTASVNPQTDNAPLSVGSPTPLPQKTWSVTCSQPSFHDFSVQTVVAWGEVHVTDPFSGNDSGNGQDTTAVTAEADLEVVSVNVAAPAGANLYVPFDVAVDATVRNNGPYGPANADVTVTLTIPNGCSASPPSSQSEDDMSLAASGTVAVPTKSWTVTCTQLLTTVFSATVGAAVDQLHVSDPQGGNDGLGADAPNPTGVGLSDGDGDGVPDSFDACPGPLEDMDGFQDADGCPDTDNDLDGICDAGVPPVADECTGFDFGRFVWELPLPPTQSCRNSAEDVDAFHDDDGCPEPDNDNDGFPDYADDCPGTDYTAGTDGVADSGDEPFDLLGARIQTKEDFDGVLDADGCHDSPGGDYDGDAFTDEDEVFIYGTDPADRDTDDDGINDGVDGLSARGDQATILSNAFTDVSGGTTSGSLVVAGTTTPYASDLPDPDGVRVDAIGGTGSVTVSACTSPPASWVLNPGESVDVFCSSARGRVIVGPVEMTFGGITATLPSLTSATIEETAPAVFEVTAGGLSAINVGGLSVAPGQTVEVTDTDTDGQVNQADLDDDGDDVYDSAESSCGSNPLNPDRRPERLDLPGDDDGDTLVDESLPGGSAGFDCDGDGWTGAQEALISGTGGTVSDQDACGNNGWPADLDSNNMLSIGDFNSFVFPNGPDDGHGVFAYFSHPVPDAGRVNEERWDLSPNGVIDIGDINALNPGVTAPTARPPMFGGQPAFFAGACPWPP